MSNLLDLTTIESDHFYDTLALLEVKSWEKKALSVSRMGAEAGPVVVAISMISGLELDLNCWQSRSDLHFQLDFLQFSTKISLSQPSQP